MGMFDQYKPFEEHFNPGDRFVLQAAKLGAVLNTSYGESQQVLFKINDEVYSALGSGFVQQVTRLEANELPREVAYGVIPTKNGNRVKLLMRPQEVDLSGAPVGDEVPF